MELQHLRDFLANAGEEGLTWEAKGDEPREGGKRMRAEHLQRSACAFANQVGGYVLIGVHRNDGHWEVPGIVAPAAEPELWLDQVLAGLRPIPRYERKAWEVADGADSRGRPCRARDSNAMHDPRRTGLRARLGCEY